MGGVDNEGNATLILVDTVEHGMTAAEPDNMKVVFSEDVDGRMSDASYNILNPILSDSTLPPSVARSAIDHRSVASNSGVVVDFESTWRKKPALL